MPATYFLSAIPYPYPCIQVDSYGLAVNAAADSRLIKVKVCDVKTRIRNQTEKENEDDIMRENVLSVNGHTISIDNQTAQHYLHNSRRIIETHLNMAIKCTKEIVGGGLSFKD